MAMQSFRYTATDSSGKGVNGTIHAKDAAEAMSNLSLRGFQNVRLGADQVTANYIRTGKAKDEDRMYLYAQAASLIRAGINPFQAFGTLAGRVTNKWLQQACTAIANEAKEGIGVSRVMEKYVDLFPHNDVAMVRAGEMGGFLPESLEYLAQHYTESTSFKRRFWFFRLFGWQLYLTFVLMVPIPNAFWAGFHAGTVQGFFRSYLDQVIWPVGPIGILLAVLYYLGQWILKQPQNTRLRHSLILKMPMGIGARARMESIRAFLWTLRNLFSGGVGPSASWALASASSPNAEVAVQLAQAGGNMTSETPASVAFVNSGLFPSEYAPMIRTAEQAGDMVATLDRMVNLANEGFEAGKQRVAIGLASLGCILTLIGTGVLAIWLVKGYYGRVFDEVEKYVQE